MKFDFKKIIRISITLMIVAGLSAVLIVLLNQVTGPVIEQNNIKAEEKACAQIFTDAKYNEIENQNENIEKIYKVTKDEYLIGYIYKVSGKNAYGGITMMIGIDVEGTVTKVVLTENSESFAGKVNDHVESNYLEGTLNNSNIDDVDTKCGATYGAKLVKELVKIALDDFTTVQGGDK